MAHGWTKVPSSPSIYFAAHDDSYQVQGVQFLLRESKFVSSLFRSVLHCRLVFLDNKWLFGLPSVPTACSPRVLPSTISV